MVYYKSKQNSFHLEAKEGDFLLVSNSSETAKNQKETKSKMNKTIEKNWRKRNQFDSKTKSWSKIEGFFSFDAKILFVVKNMKRTKAKQN